MYELWLNVSLKKRGEIYKYIYKITRDIKCYTRIPVKNDKNLSLLLCFFWFSYTRDDKRLDLYYVVFVLYRYCVVFK